VCGGHDVGVLEGAAAPAPPATRASGGEGKGRSV